MSDQPNPEQNNQTNSLHKIHLRPIVWIPIVVVIAFATGYLVWDKTNHAWPFESAILDSLKHTGKADLQWEVYSGLGYEFRYPSVILKLTETKTGPILFHTLQNFHKSSAKDSSDLGLASDINNRAVSPSARH